LVIERDKTAVTQSAEKATQSGWKPQKRFASESESPALDLSRNMVPIYLQLITIFRRFIESGDWPLNEQIPTLAQLSERFGVAHATIRQAISQLEQEGLLARYRRKGTFVMARPKPQPFHFVATRWEDIPPSYASLQAAELKSVDDFSNLSLEDKEEDSGGPLLRLLFRHEDGPILVESARLEAALYVRLGEERLRTNSVLACLAGGEQKPISRLDQLIVVRSADATTARQLQVPLNAPLLVVRWKGYANERCICVVESVYRADRVKLIEHFDV
jgi:GntR family transcriptional regulator